MSDQDLKKFYYDLMISEAGHYNNFLKLAKTYMEDHLVLKRWNELLKVEAVIMKSMEIRGDRIH